MRSSNVLTMIPSGSEVASKAISFLTVLKNFFASAGWNSIFLNECVSMREESDRQTFEQQQKEIKMYKCNSARVGRRGFIKLMDVCASVTDEHDHRMRMRNGS